jgi:indole-3-glycerol phosphate synthase
MDILEKIVAEKRKEVDKRKRSLSIGQLEKMPLFGSATISLCDAILDDNKTGIIAEFKRRSPSKGIINNTADLKEVTTAYAENGASGISVLTDETFFGGTLKDLEIAYTSDTPLLRKDFMIDEYQLVEAKAYGASVILLIAACLTPGEVKNLAAAAKNLGLEVLLEIQNEDELNHICEDADMVGINNRNLKNFDVNLDNSANLVKRIPTDKITIAESGISDINTITILKEAGFKGFLMGEYFMKQPNPSIAFAEFSKLLKATYES